MKGGLLNPADPKRVMSAYLDPADAKLFDVSSQGTSVARSMSGGVGNAPMRGEYVLPPALVKIMREGTSGPGFNTMIGNSESIMKNLDAFYKKLGGRDGGRPGATRSMFGRRQDEGLVRGSVFDNKSYNFPHLDFPRSM